MLYNIRMPFRTNLVLARQALKWSQDRLGEEVGVTGSAVSQWERGVADPELEKIPLIANALQKPVGWLFDDETRLSAVEKEILDLLGAAMPTERKGALRMLKAYLRQD